METKQFAPGDDLKASVLNPPINKLAQAITAIEQSIKTSTDKTTTLQKGCVCRNDVILGDVVSISEGIMTKAQAVWSNTFNDKGELIAASTAYPIGIVTAKTSTNYCTIATGGAIHASNTLLTALFGTTTPAAGVYYLSSSQAGKVTNVLPAVAIRVLTVDVYGFVYITPGIPPAEYHVHKIFELTGAWLDVGASQFDGMDKPAGALYGYDLANDSEVKDYFNMFGGQAVAVQDGLIASEYISVNAYNVWSSSADAPTAVTLHTTVPVPAGQAIIRAVKIAGSGLNASVSNGILTLTATPVSMSIDAPVASATAVSTISNGVANTTPIVSRIINRKGLNITDMGNGVMALGVGAGSYEYLYPQVSDLSNAQVNSSGNKIYIMFPRSRSSSVTGVFRLAAAPEGTKYLITPFIEPAGLNGAFSLSGITYSMAFTPMAIGSAKAGVDTTVTGAMPSVSIAANSQYLCIGDSPIYTQLAGSLYYRVAAVNPSVDLSITGFGLQVTMENV